MLEEVVMVLRHLPIESVEDIAEVLEALKSITEPESGHTVPKHLYGPIENISQFIFDAEDYQINGRQIKEKVQDFIDELEKLNTNEKKEHYIKQHHTSPHIPEA